MNFQLVRAAAARVRRFEWGHDEECPHRYCEREPGSECEPERCLASPTAPACSPDACAGAAVLDLLWAVARGDRGPQAAVEQWNSRYSVGTPVEVTVWRCADGAAGETFRSRTRSLAWVAGGGPMVLVQGRAGGSVMASLDFVRPLDAPREVEP